MTSRSEKNDPLRLIEDDQVRAPAALTQSILRAARNDTAVTGPPGWIAWLTQGIWRPALSAALPVIIGYAIGLGVPLEDDIAYQPELLVSAAAIDLWLDPMLDGDAGEE